MLSTTGIHYSRPNSQIFHPSLLHQSQGEVQEWNSACHPANSSFVSTGTPSYSSYSSPSSITVAAISPFDPSSASASSPYAYSSQAPKPTPTTTTATSSSSRLPAPSSSSSSSSAAQAPLHLQPVLQDITNARACSLSLTTAPLDGKHQSDEDYCYLSYSRSSDLPTLSPRLPALHAQLGTPSSRLHRPADMASVAAAGVDSSKSPKNPRGRIFGGWLSGKPSPNMSPSTSSTKGEEEPMSPTLLPPTLSSPGLSPDSAMKKPSIPRRFSLASNTPSAAPSESITPRNSSPAVANPKRLSLLQTSLSAITRLAAPAMTADEMDDGLNDDDELLHLDIEAALYPGGSPADSFSPAAYKNLQMNALGLVQKLHGAYRSRTMAVRALEVERDAQKEDLIEARTRALRLKQQVENMTKQAAEQERSMMELMNELAAEKRARINETNEREKNLNMVPETPESKREGSFTEDLGVDEEEGQRKWRKSAGTIRSDISFDTDEESIEADSIFSRSRSPTIPSAAPTETTTTPIQIKALGPPRSRSSLQMSAFQKILKGMTKAEEEDACRNCKGQTASIAWDTVSLLRDENKALKSRVGELEVAVESAMDIVNGVGL